jgi:hypothetical protein
LSFASYAAFMLMSSPEPGPDSLWISRQEARALRLFLTILFIGQAVFETINNEFDLTKTAWFWGAALASFVGLWLLEIVLVAVNEIITHYQPSFPEKRYFPEPVLPVYASPSNSSSTNSRSRMLYSSSRNFSSSMYSLND